MALNVNKEVREMEKLTVRELRKQYADVFGETTNAANKPWLIKRIAWRMQSNIEGDISQRARDRATEIANDGDVRMSAPLQIAPPKPAMLPTASRTKTSTVVFKHDERLPLPGTTFPRVYKGVTHQVKVLPAGFEYDGEVYKSLTAVAKAITGQHCSGYTFFKIGKAQQ